MDLSKMDKDELINLQYEVNEALEARKVIDEIDKINEFTDQLNSMHQHIAMETHCPDEANELYAIMQRMDKRYVELARDYGIE